MQHQPAVLNREAEYDTFMAEQFRAFHLRLQESRSKLGYYDAVNDDDNSGGDSDSNAESAGQRCCLSDVDEVGVLDWAVFLRQLLSSS